MDPIAIARMNDIEYFEKYLKIRPMEPSGAVGGLASLRINSVQKHILENLRRRTVVLKSRRVGCSTLVQALLYRKTTHKSGINTTTAAHKAQSTNYLFNMSKIFYENFPPEFKPKTGHYSNREMTFPFLNSSMIALTTAKGGGGRGETIQLLHCSEYAWWLWPDQFMGLTEAVPNTQSSMIIVESTPNGAAGGFYELYQQAKAGKGGWNAIFIPWFWDDNCKLPVGRNESLEPYSSDEEKLIAKHNLTPAQIKWRRWKIEDIAAKNKGDPDLFYQEYPEDDESCFLTSGLCFFSAPNLRALIERCPGEYLFDDEEWLIWKEPEPGHQYVVGADVARGNIGDDFSAAVIRDRKTNERVATLNAVMTPFQFAEELVRMAYHYNEALLGVERNDAGISTLEKALELGYDNLFYHDDGDIGWKTTSKTRLPMLQDLRKEIADADSIFNDEKLLKQMLQFMRGEGVGGHPEAAPGEHDDMVIADAIAGQMRKIEEGSIDQF